LQLSRERRLAHEHVPGEPPGVLFCGGFTSDMTGTKALAMEAFCREQGRAFTRFDYSGHGSSSGDFADGTIGGWADDALAVVDRVTEGPLLVVGSSMGGWIMLLVALARPDRIAGLIGIAAAPDFTRIFCWRAPRPSSAARSPSRATGCRPQTTAAIHIR
jgi:pimeloyl-ACP methyl ester carboxylesterase